MSRYNRPYVEASVWIAFIKGETRDDGKHDCKAVFDSVLQAAENGEFQIFTSSLTIAEVCRKKDAPKLTEEENEDLRPYFREAYIALIEVDRDIAERANELCRLHLQGGDTPALRPNDAIHLACAERAGCEVLLAYDKHLTRWQHDTIRSEWPSSTDAVKQALAAVAAESLQETLSLFTEDQKSPDVATTEPTPAVATPPETKAEELAGTKSKGPDVFKASDPPRL